MLLEEVGLLTNKEELTNEELVSVLNLLIEQGFDYDLDILENAFELIFSMYAATGNLFKEEVTLYKAILMGFLNLEIEIVEYIVETLGWYQFLMWCNQTLKTKPEVMYFIEKYQQYHTQKISAAEIVTHFLEGFIEDFADTDINSINELVGSLGEQIKRLPDFLKNE